MTATRCCVSSTGRWPSTSPIPAGSVTTPSSKRGTLCPEKFRKIFLEAVAVKDAEGK
jgi:hypothetical protein